jgi:hypothetical protein
LTFTDTAPIRRQWLKVELQRNIWAVRFPYYHILNRVYAYARRWSMVEHIGFDVEATTNAKDGSTWDNPPLKPCPPVLLYNG